MTSAIRYVYTRFSKVKRRCYSYVQVNSGSRRLYFGTMNIPGVIPIYDSVHSSAAHKGLNHTLSIPTLPRDLTMAQVRKRSFSNDLC